MQVAIDLLDKLYDEKYVWFINACMEIQFVIINNNIFMFTHILDGYNVHVHVDGVDIV